MRTPLFDRRDFLKAAGATFLLSLTPAKRALALETDAMFATAYQARTGEYGVAVLSEAGKILHSVILPERGHDVTFDPISRKSVVFARQPGTFMMVFDHTGRGKPLTIPSIAGRHYYGHGVFSPDGALLYVTENDFDNAAGMVGVYDARDGFRRLSEFPTHGVGPHELILLGDGKTLAICNGGIETHPDFGRAKLNIPTMKPSFVLVDRISGDLLEKHELPEKLHQLSIRHMDIDAQGTVWFGCQHEGPASETPLLVGRAVRGKELEMLDMPEDLLGGFRNYIGSVAANREAGLIAVSSPQGNIWATIEAASGKVVARNDLVEVCGLAPDRDGFLATTGAGKVVEPDGKQTDDPEHVWDNHMLRIDLQNT
ncbi:DUF1513 domain-containing protein [Aminobacter sp. HY435]|uniref:DUF1513 domain-containing protein n=1 Tax=Aminobacter sp. HY435 TaxID=2970917 RepID=UPI0022B9A047|nr:DUF1513 domain-containing protein [Aminobacter sp. HY435]